MTGVARAREILDYAAQHGDLSAQAVMGITEETLKRIRRQYRKELGDELDNTRLLRDIQAKFTPAELKTMVKSANTGLARPGKVEIKLGGECIRFGFFTDSHMGADTYRPEFLEAAARKYDNAKVQFIMIAGDVTEGMSGRPGHIYECTHLGFTAQRDYAIQQLSLLQFPLYMIDGNHDRWFIKSSGALIVKDIAEALPDAHFLGHDEGDLTINGVTIKLFHGEDGSTYAISYRSQKLVESFTGGEKPNVLLLGHDHKHVTLWERNIQIVGGGCLSLQSRWMRSKRIAAHPGFWVISMIVNETGIADFTTSWTPIYV